MKFMKLTNTLSSVLCLVGLSACSGGRSEERPSSLPNSVPTIREAFALFGSLIQVNQVKASRYIKNGIYPDIAQYAYQTAVPSASTETTRPPQNEFTFLS